LHGGEDAPRRGVLNLQDLAMFREILRDSFVYQVTTVLNFLITLAIFPAATVLVEPSEQSGESAGQVHGKHDSVQRIFM
jgi:hypothetical protein